MATTILREAKIKSGKVSLFLDQHLDGLRKKTFLNIYTWAEADAKKSIEKRNERKSAYELAEKIVSKKHYELISGINGLPKEKSDHLSFSDYYDLHVKNLKVKEKRAYKAAINKLREYLRKDNIRFGEVTETVMIKFLQFLECHLHGETPYGYLKKMRRVMKAATKEGFFNRNPCEDIRVSKLKSEEKEVLSYDEIAKLAKTPCGNRAVKNAFLFTCVTGLRFCDIKTLKWENISDGKLCITQNKTETSLSMLLPEAALRILEECSKVSPFVFKLPSHNGCMKNLRYWVKRAKINKHITWHCGRHSFGTNILNEGKIDIYTVSKLLGHSSIKHTERYLRASEELKAKAIETIPNFFNTKNREHEKENPNLRAVK